MLQFLSFICYFVIFEKQLNMIKLKILNDNIHKNKILKNKKIKIYDTK